MSRYRTLRADREPLWRWPFVTQSLELLGFVVPRGFRLASARQATNVTGLVSHIHVEMAPNYPIVGGKITIRGERLGAIPCVGIGFANDTPLGFDEDNHVALISIVV